MRRMTILQPEIQCPARSTVLMISFFQSRGSRFQAQVLNHNCSLLRTLFSAHALIVWMPASVANLSLYTSQIYKLSLKL